MSGADMVGIVTALPEELEAVLSRASNVRRERDGFFRASIGAEAVVVTATGDGSPRAGRGAAALCDAYRPKALLGAGVAGSLSEDFAPGELVLASRICDAAGEVPAPDERLLSRALSLPGLRASTLVTAADPVVTRGAKAAIAAAQGGACAAVDMESAAWAREAAGRRVPYLIVRAICDGAREELPGYLSKCVDAEGSILRSRVIARALARPASIPALLFLRRRVREGARNLAAFLEQLLRGSL